jgi:hypothetical protein
MTQFQFDVVVHATHEAGLKVGGIGAVLDGLLGQPSYNNAVRRTILVGPFDAWNGLEMEGLYAPRNGFKPRYSAHNGMYEVPEELARALTRIEMGFHVRLLYGTRRFGGFDHEVLLVDPQGAEEKASNDLKHFLWERHGINSPRYEKYDEFQRYLNAAEPAFAALQVIKQHVLPGNAESPERAIMIAHEWLGLPLTFCAQRHQPGAYRTVFYAHETATVRPLIEGHPGHDTRFYNAMYAARERGLSLSDVFGNQFANYKHALLIAAATCDGIFAVGDLVVDELQFLSPAYRSRAISLVYNGVPSLRVTRKDRSHSRHLLQRYIQNILGYRPTWVFTHVTRMVPSKALWRDVRVLEQLDGELAQRGETAALITLSSAIPAGRRGEDVRRWEAEYGWPVTHRGNTGDLVSDEWPYYSTIEHFNRSARASRIVLVNQFGWSRDRCGNRMPAEMEFDDIRHGSDLEFGQSIYEPFGIGQVEPLCAGALCCLSNVCGCVGFVNKRSGLDHANVIVADYVTLPEPVGKLTLSQILSIGQSDRDIVEGYEARRIAPLIAARLPREESAARQLMEGGFHLSEQMSWAVVVEALFLPALEELF